MKHRVVVIVTRCSNRTAIYKGFYVTKYRTFGSECRNFLMAGGIP